MKLAKQARAAGAEVICLTGRIADLEPATIAQLKRFGLQDVDARTVVSKPDLSVRTATFKTSWLQQSADDGHHLAFFLTESRRDVGAIQRGLAGAPAVLLTSGVGGLDAIGAQTPLFRR